MYKLGLEKAEEPEVKLPKSIISKKKACKGISKFIDCGKAFNCVGHNNLWKILKEMRMPAILPAYWETCMEVKKQQLEIDMQQQTGSKLGKEYVEAIYYHPPYLTYMQSTSCKIPGGWSTSWNQDCQEKYQ